MKLRKYIPALGLSALLLGSCADQLNLSPFDAVSVEEAFVTNSDFDNAIRGVYGGLRDNEWYGGNYILHPDLLADNLIIASEGRLSQQSRHFWIHAGNSTWALWDDGYRVALRANLLLENIDALADGAVKDNFQGQALALRALAHFDMARIYCKPPQYAGGSDLGIPYMISSDASQKPARPSVQETFDNIVADLETALDLVEADNGIYQLGETGVNALLARVHFYMGNNTEAAAYATAAIDAAPGIASRADFGDVWTDDSEAGVIFKVANTNQDNIGVGVQYSQTGPTGVRSEYVVDYQFYQDFLAGDNDVRADEYFSTSDFADQTWNHIAKWFGRTGANANVSDIQVLRMEEMYLTRAEALAGTDDAAALADLNVIRDERYDSYPDNETGAALLDAIQEERRKELAFEGHRFFDLKRLGESVTRSAFGDYFDGTGVALPGDVRTLPAGDFRFELPLPQSELNANDNMEQNPGY